MTIQQLTENIESIISEQNALRESGAEPGGIYVSHMAMAAAYGALTMRVEIILDDVRRSTVAVAA